jgi:hypothetical protein
MGLLPPRFGVVGLYGRPRDSVIVGCDGTKAARRILKEPNVRRKTFDTLLSFAGVIVTIGLVVAGSLLLWGHSFAESNVHSQLAEQQISFPTATELAHPNGGEITVAMQKTLGPYAGKAVTTGPEAKAYADDFIAVHLSEMPYHGVYSQVSAAALAQPNNTQLKALETTVFQGTTLRGLLLEAYGFSEFGTIALFSAIACFILAGVMALLCGFGVWHLRRTNPAEELLARTLRLDEPAPV